MQSIYLLCKILCSHFIIEIEIRCKLTIKLIIKLNSFFCFHDNPISNKAQTELIESLVSWTGFEWQPVGQQHKEIEDMLPAGHPEEMHTATME